jgi:hypothetical protein
MRIIQHKISKIRGEVKKQNTTQKHSKYKCAPRLCIHVSFACNQQLAHCKVTIQGSAMQSGPLFTGTEN